MADTFPAPSLAIVPPAQAPRQSLGVGATQHKELGGAHDTMRFGQRSLIHEAAPQHPMQNRLERWDETRDNLKLTLQRNMFGLGVPMRQLMERKIVRHNVHFPTRPVSNIHLDILTGNDETLEPVDFLPSEAGSEQLDIHAAMERKMRI